MARTSTLSSLYDKPLLAAAVVIGLAWTAPAASQELVVNGRFDASLAGWNTQGSTNVQADWIALDAGGFPGSGSAQVSNSHPTASQGVTLKQCLPAIAGHRYNQGGRVRVPSGPGQSLANNAVLSLRFATDAACTSFPSGSINLSPSPASFDTWVVRGPEERIAPAGTQSVQVRLLVSKVAAGGSFVAQFDDVYLTVQDAVFASGFQ